MCVSEICGRGKPLPYGVSADGRPQVSVFYGTQIRDVEDAVPYGCEAVVWVRVVQRDVEDAVPDGCDAVVWARVVQRDVEDAVPDGCEAVGLGAGRTPGRRGRRPLRGEVHKTDGSYNRRIWFWISVLTASASLSSDWMRAKSRP